MLQPLRALRVTGSSRLHHRSRNVGDDPRDTAPPQPARGVRGVHRPHVHRAAVRPRGGDEPARRHRQPAVSQRDREHPIARRRCAAPEQRRPVECRDLGGRGPASKGRLVEREQCLAVLRRDHAPRRRVLLDEHPPHRLLRRRLLDLHQDVQPRKGPEHLAQRRNPRLSPAIGMGAAVVGGEVPSGIHRAQLGEGESGHRAGPVGGAVEGSVVNHHGGAVGGEPHVELDRVRAAPHGRLERRQRVFRCLRGGAAVRDDEACVGVEQRVHCGMAVEEIEHDPGRVEVAGDASDRATHGRATRPGVAAALDREQHDVAALAAAGVGRAPDAGAVGDGVGLVPRPPALRCSR